MEQPCNKSFKRLTLLFRFFFFLNPLSLQVHQSPLIEETFVLRSSFWIKDAKLLAVHLKGDGQGSAHINANPNANAKKEELVDTEPFAT